MNATIQGNFFNEGNVAGGRAIELLNHNSTGATFGSIVIGGAGALQNTFQDGLDYFIYLDGDTFANSQASGRPNYTAYGSTTMAPFPVSLNVANNSFDGLNYFRIEDKMHHRIDTDTPLSTGLLTWVTGNVYVTDAGTDHSIQRGINAASVNEPSMSRPETTSKTSSSTSQ